MKYRFYCPCPCHAYFRGWSPDLASKYRKWRVTGSLLDLWTWNDVLASIEKRNP